MQLSVPQVMLPATGIRFSGAGTITNLAWGAISISKLFAPVIRWVLAARPKSRELKLPGGAPIIGDMPKFWAVIAACVLCATLGCRSTATSRKLLVSPYKVTNVYLRQPRLPAELSRVAVLPFPKAGRVSADIASRTALEPLFQAELRKRKRFEVIPVTQQELSVWTGKSTWDATGELPAGLLATIQKETGCDAVIFPALTTFNPYPPVAIGWNVKLVLCADRNIWWSVDEVFDAGNESVAAAAEAYGRREMTMPAPLLENSAILASPRRFGQYTAWAVASTLPQE